MKHLNAIFSLILLLPLSLLAQKTYPTGLIMDDDEYARQPYVSENLQIDFGQKFAASSVDLSPYCPEVRHQGDISSCVGWSAGYAALTIERAILNEWTDPNFISENANSAMFVFNQLNSGNCMQGITFPKALKLMQKKGNCLARDFDFDVNDCEEPVTEELKNQAGAYRIEEYIRLFNLDATREEKVKNVKLVLVQNKPVIVGMKILQNFYDIEEGDNHWWPTIGDKTYRGGHAMVVVGYDDYKFRKPGRKTVPQMEGAFKIMNSWGKNWAKDGFVWVRYAHFAEYCNHAYAIKLAEGAPIDFNYNMERAPEGQQQKENIVAERGPKSRDLLQLSGSFGFRYFVDWDQGKPVFAEAEVQLQGDHYALKGDWQLGDQFQLYVKSEFDNGYIYVLSVDPIGKTQVHFPKSEAYNVKFKGLNESAFIMNGGSLLTIPSSDSVLKLAHTGRDNLIVLFTTKKIVPEAMERITGALSGTTKKDLTKKLYNILNKYLVPTADITYNRNEMGFDVSSRSGGRIVPIVLTVEVGE